MANQVGSLTNAAELASTLDVSKTAIDRYLYVMRLSFHISLVRPFFRNIRKELTKMPKVYFHDLGLRNFFVGSFDAFEIRDDKGELLENAVFRQLLVKNNAEDINFWRTTQKNEVDFIVNGADAFEVKSDVTKFNKKKYESFLGSYPKINFSLVTIDKKRADLDGYTVLNAWEV